MNSACGETQKVFNPLKGISGYGWHFEQEVYLPIGITRALKAGGGSGNIPKVILKDNTYFTVEDGNENCIECFENEEMAIKSCVTNSDAKEVFKFKNNELVDCVFSKIAVENDILPAALKYQRTEYAKKIRREKLSNK